jgi:hypothetical protein
MLWRVRGRLTDPGDPRRTLKDVSSDPGVMREESGGFFRTSEECLDASMASEHPGRGVSLMRERRTAGRNRHGRIARHRAGPVAGYCRLGFRVVATSRSIASSNDEHGLAIAGDIRDRATAQRVVAAAKQRSGRVDTLVSNAGISSPSRSSSIRRRTSTR